MQQKPADVLKIVLVSTLLAAGGVQAQSSSTDSILTVDELLRIENAQVRDNAKKAAVAAGLLAPNTPSIPGLNAGPKRPMAPAAPVVTIHAIKGVGALYRVDLTYNGELHKDVQINSRVKGRFVLATVQDACVTVTSLDKAYESAVACWTGFDPEPSEAPAMAGLVAEPMRGGPLPMQSTPGRPLPIPTIPGSVPGAMPSPTGAKVR